MAPPDRLRLSGCRIRSDSRAPPPLAYAIAEARAYLEERTGRPVPLVDRPGARAPDAVVDVTVDVAPADRGRPLESFRLRTGTRAGRSFAAVEGSDPIAAARGLSRLVGSIAVDDGGAWLPGALDLERTARYRLRGLHPNGWAANHPSSFRCWSEADWRRYVDILFHLGVNHLLLWPAVDILPFPLSRSDEEYLHEVRRVVAHARDIRGMEVWIMQSANRVALSEAGVDDPRLRPYWLPGVQVDLDPGDPVQLDAIMRSREPLYRIVDNADGFAIIDSDPGGWNGSPVRAYLGLLYRTRDLLDRSCVRGAAVKLVSWLWQGWGYTSWDPAGREPVIRETVEGMRRLLPEPWMLIAGTGHYLPYLSRLGALDRTVYLPYGVIEAEPSLPFTNVDPDAVRGALAGAAGFPGLAGLMGNVQCPLLQLPQVHGLMEGLWASAPISSGACDGLRALARLLHPRDEGAIVAAFEALNATDPSRIGGVLARLQRLAAADAVTAGAVGRLLFPSSRQAIGDLADQLEVRLAEAAFASAVESGSGAASLQPLVAAYFRQCLRWEERHGYFGVVRAGRLESLFPRPPIPRDTIRTWPPFLPYARGLRAALERAGDPEGERFFAPIARELAAEFAQENVDRGCIEAMRRMMARGL